jgi:hypothetical protein
MKIWIIYLRCIIIHNPVQGASYFPEVPVTHRGINSRGFAALLSRYATTPNGMAFSSEDEGDEPPGLLHVGPVFCPEVPDALAFLGDSGGDQTGDCDHQYGGGRP